MAAHLVPRASDPNQPASNSASGLLSTLIPTFLVACVFVGLFLVFRVKFKRIYQPRTYIGALQDHQKTPRPSDSKFGWISDFTSIPTEYVLNHHSIDGYFYLRFFRTLILICLVGWPITWAVLMPVYATSHKGQEQFDRISYANVDSTIDANRLYAVVFVAWFFLGAIMFIIGRESIHYVQAKQAFLALPGIASLMASRTVLFTNVPDDYLQERKIRQEFPSVKHVWGAPDTKELEEMVEDRDKAAMKLEGAEVSLSRDANNKRLKALKKGGKPEASEDPLRWLDDKKRPKHRLGFLGLIGKKVDSIDWCRSHLAEVIPKVRKEQETKIAGTGKLASAVFIEFDNIQTSEGAFHQTNVKLPKGFQSRAVGQRPEEIIFKNLNMSESQRKIRNIVARAIILSMIMYWLPITAFVGALSNINSLITLAPFLKFINSIPAVVLGVVTGLLPTIILAVCLVLVPIIMRLLFKLAGAVTLTEVELKTQTWYFVFQVIQVFLVPTLASGAVSTVNSIIKKPSDAGALLAANLPRASNFYIDYFVLYGIGVSSKTVLNIVALLLYLILGKFLDKTPRKMYNRYLKLPSLGWGSVYPVFTNLGVIAITYSCISPLILGFAAVGFFLVYIAMRYNVYYTLDTMAINTQGQSFAKAIQQLTTGVYISSLCLIGLFGASTGSSPKAAGPLALMIVFLVGAVIFHIILNRTIKSLEKNVARDPDAATMATEQKLAEVKVSESSDSPKPEAHLPPPSVNNKPTSFLVKLLHAPKLPSFDPYLSSPLSEYDPDVRRLAYLNPSITSRVPTLWIARDEMGISTREKAETGKVIGISDEEAWFDEKGKLVTCWTASEEEGKSDLARKAPIYKKPVYY